METIEKPHFTPLRAENISDGIWNVDLKTSSKGSVSYWQQIILTLINFSVKDGLELK